ncbi:hypothetical protein DPMN_188377 [Dreissena polymorpha]|uniref:Uncharacterized protein n=1 Tax=Dreissena polymorpha TaxID=45954 RepID=A0A9D4DQP2_DREPO|nr:hypothetical protein DPMN_188377 [Dreissena polymorpha]
MSDDRLSGLCMITSQDMAKIHNVRRQALRIVHENESSMAKIHHVRRQALRIVHDNESRHG